MLCLVHHFQGLRVELCWEKFIVRIHNSCINTLPNRLLAVNASSYGCIVHAYGLHSTADHISSQQYLEFMLTPSLTIPESATELQLVMKSNCQIISVLSNTASLSACEQLRVSSFPSPTVHQPGSYHPRVNRRYWGYLTSW